MNEHVLSAGTVHNKIPSDLLIALLSDDEASTLWQSLTPLARNEWICWTISVKQQKTREEHVKRVVKELKEGKRRPCCWVGCLHRTDKNPSASQKWVAGKTK